MAPNFTDSKWYYMELSFWILAMQLSEGRVIGIYATFPYGVRRSSLQQWKKKHVPGVKQGSLIQE